MNAAADSAAFWRGRSVLLTGHTGFKGAWAAMWLTHMGAQVHGYALAPEGEPNLWTMCGRGLLASETLVDINDDGALRGAIASADPQIVLHLAAQALVRRSYDEPLSTMATNVLGTARLLDALRRSNRLEAIVIATTDKVYANAELGRDFIESDPLGGHDPYSASKAAAELVTRSYAQCFFEPRGIPVATARAGNVIGGGDWSADRLVPDAWRAARARRPLLLRYPAATRPWQHVLEPLHGYFRYAESLAEGNDPPRALNFGPLPGMNVTVAEVADAIGAALGVEGAWQPDEGNHPPEMRLLSLDPSLAASALRWHPQLSNEECIAWTGRWYADHARGMDPYALCLSQISDYEARL